MIRSNNSSHSGYIKLQQESDNYEEEFSLSSDPDLNSKPIFTKPRYHQKRSLSESVRPHVDFQIPKNRMDYENESNNIGNNDSNSHNSNSLRTARSSTWFKKFGLKGKGKGSNKTELDIYDSVFKPTPNMLQDWKVSNITTIKSLLCNL